MSTHKTVKASKLKALKVNSVNLESFKEYKSSVNLEDKKKVTKLLTDMFSVGDYDSFMELMGLYVDQIGKKSFPKKITSSTEGIFKVMKSLNETKPKKKAS